MEIYCEKLVISSTFGASHGNVTSVGSFYELHVNCMATACVVDNALFRQINKKIALNKKKERSLSFMAISALSSRICAN